MEREDFCDLVDGEDLTDPANNPLIPTGEPETAERDPDDMADPRNNPLIPDGGDGAEADGGTPTVRGCRFEYATGEQRDPGLERVLAQGIRTGAWEDLDDA